MTATLKYIESANVAIIGPQSSELVGVLSHLGNELHVPILSFTALDPSLSSFQYPYFLQTAPNDLYQMKALAALVSYSGYREVVAVFTDNGQFHNGINVFGNELTKKRCRLSGKAPLPFDSQLTREVLKDSLVKILSMESRVILVHTYSNAGLSIIEIAKSLGMMERGYVWIATTWLSFVLDFTGIPPKNVETLHGILTLRPHTPDSYSKKAFSRRWKNLSNESAIGITPYGLYAYEYSLYHIPNHAERLGITTLILHSNPDCLHNRYRNVAKFFKSRNFMFLPCSCPNLSNTDPLFVASLPSILASFI